LSIAASWVVNATTANGGSAITGGIQPKVLRSSLGPDHISAGAPAHILFACPPYQKKEWTEDDLDEVAVQAYHSLIGGLAGLKPQADADGEPYPLTLSLTPEAKAAWVQFYTRFADRQEGAEGDLAAAFSKLEGYAARLVLLHHVCESVAAGGDATDPVPVGSVRAGIELAEWSAYEAERLYQMLGEAEEEEATRKLVEIVTRLAGRNCGRVTPKLLQRSNQRKYRSSEAAEAVLDTLVGLGLGRWDESPAGPKGGRPSRAFVLRVKCDETDETTPDGEGGPGDDDGDSGDDTGGRVTEPRAGGPRPNPGSCYSGSAYAESAANGTGVSSVSSYVTQHAGSPARTTNPTSDIAGGSVTQDTVSPDPAYTLITDPAGFGAVVAAVEDSGGPVAVDCETTGLNPLSDEVRLLQVATERGVFIVDLFALPDHDAPVLADLFDVLGRVEVVGHNAQFDLRFLARHGFTPDRVFDTMLASRTFHAGDRDENGARLKHGLEDVAARELGRTLDMAEQESDWSRPTLSPGQYAYAAADAEVLLPLAEALKSTLAAADLTDTAELEMRALPGVAWAAPVTVDVAAWSAIAATAEAEVTRLADEMTTLAPNRGDLFQSRNCSSVEQVKVAFAALGIALGSTADDALAAIDHPLAAKLRDYRAATKRTGTYGKGWLRKHAAGGRVMPSWNQLGAESGRMSCSHPNLQNIPRGSEYRRCFVARPGHVLVKADYSQVELRVAAKVADEAVMIEAYRDGRDLHTLTAARITGKAEAEVTKADRQLAKAVNFGLLYGMGWKGLRGYALANYGVTLTDDQARDYRTAFFAAYPGLAAWHRRTRDRITRLGRAFKTVHDVRTVTHRRRRTLPHFKKNAEGKLYPNVTDAVNTPVQGTAADGLKIAVALLWERRVEALGAVPVIFCHDEIVVEAPEGEAANPREWLRCCMTEALAPLIDPVPVEVEVTVGRTWGG
jgi:DNA polymerase I-like protein with 3'-5' exonuclease and polymerase domains